MAIYKEIQNRCQRNAHACVPLMAGVVEAPGLLSKFSTSSL